MDIAALLGFIGAVGMILAAMIAGGGIAPFVDNQSVLIVFGGSFFGVMYSVPMPTFLAHFRLWVNVLNLECQSLMRLLSAWLSWQVWRAKTV